MNELLENEACEAIAQAVACEHSPAIPGSHEAAVIQAAEEIARRIHKRQERILRDMDQEALASGGD